jgi:Fe-S cluster assembly protein SufD
MNVVTTRNKVEQAFADLYEGVSGTLAGGMELGKKRQEAISRFAATGLPHRRIEEWKYTDLRNMLPEAYSPVAKNDAVAISKADLNSALGAFANVDAWRAVFVDGHYVDELSSVDQVEGLTLGTLSGGEAERQLSHNDSRNTVADLNTAFFSDGAEIEIAAGAGLAKPLLVVHVRAAAAPSSAFVRHAISVGDGAKCIINEVFVALESASEQAHANTLSNVTVGDDADVVHLKCIVDRGGVTHLANWQVDVGASANYRAFHFNAGAALVRTDARIRFNGADSKLDYSGAFLGQANQHTDNTFLVEHLQPRCESRELFKGVLDDRARGIFQGKVHVAQIAQKTDGKQMAQALMLSEQAEFDSKPELEIFADDVLCGHGSTSAQLDEDLLFYMRARGVPMKEARALLIESFVGEAIEQVEHEGLQLAVSSLANQWLAAH